MYIRFYASSYNCWDDGIGYVILAESEDKLERYTENLPWNQHPYQTFYVDMTDIVHYFRKDVVMANEVNE